MIGGIRLTGKLGRRFLILSVVMAIISTVVLFEVGSLSHATGIIYFTKNEMKGVADRMFENIPLDMINAYIDNKIEDDKIKEFKGRMDNIVSTEPITRVHMEVLDHFDGHVFYDSAGEYEVGYKIPVTDINSKTEVELGGDTINLQYKRDGVVMSMNVDASAINKSLVWYHNTMLAVIVAVEVLQVIITLIMVRNQVVLPLSQLHKALEGYKEMNQNDCSISNINSRKTSFVSSLDIHTNNEIEKICDNLKLLEYDVNKYIDKISELNVNVKDLEESVEERSVSTKILSLITDMQSILIKQMYKDFKSFLPILAYYFKSERVVYVERVNGMNDIMVYGNRRYKRYQTTELGIVADEYGRIQLSELPEKLRKLILDGYKKDKIGLNIFGDTYENYEWIVIVARDNINKYDIETDIVVKAVKSCINRFLMGSVKSDK